MSVSLRFTLLASWSNITCLALHSVFANWEVFHQFAHLTWVPTLHPSQTHHLYTMHLPFLFVFSCFRAVCHPRFHSLYLEPALLNCFTSLNINPSWLILSDASSTSLHFLHVWSILHHVVVLALLPTPALLFGHSCLS